MGKNMVFADGVEMLWKEIMSDEAEYGGFDYHEYAFNYENGTFIIIKEDEDFIIVDEFSNEEGEFQAVFGISEYDFFDLSFNNFFNFVTNGIYYNTVEVL